MINLIIQGIQRKVTLKQPLYRRFDKRDKNSVADLRAAKRETKKVEELSGREAKKCSTIKIYQYL